MRIAQNSDFHFTRLTLNPFRLFSKRILSHLNWLIFRRKNFFESQVFSLPELFTEKKVDFVLLGGDLSTSSLDKEFQEALRFAKLLPCPWFAIPGNHDVYTKRSYKKKHFYRYFASPEKPIDERASFFRLNQHGIEATKLKDNWRLIRLDTAIATNPYSSQGNFSKKLEMRFNELLSLIAPNEHILLLNHYPLFQNDEKRRALKGAAALQKIIANDPRIKLYLHGHTHRHTIADLKAANLPLLLDSGACAAGSHASFNLIDLSESSAVITPYFWNTQWIAAPTQTYLLK